MDNAFTPQNTITHVCMHADELQSSTHVFGLMSNLLFTRFFVRCSPSLGITIYTQTNKHTHTHTHTVSYRRRARCQLHSILWLVAFCSRRCEAGATSRQWAGHGLCIRTWCCGRRHRRHSRRRCPRGRRCGWRLGDGKVTWKACSAPGSREG